MFFDPDKLGLQSTFLRLSTKEKGDFNPFQVVKPRNRFKIILNEFMRNF